MALFSDFRHFFFQYILEFTMSNRNDTIESLHHRQVEEMQNATGGIISDALSTNNTDKVSSPPGVKTNFETTEAAMDYLASILVDGFFKIKQDEYKKRKDK